MVIAIADKIWNVDIKLNNDVNSIDKQKSQTQWQRMTQWRQANDSEAKWPNDK